MKRLLIVLFIGELLLSIGVGISFTHSSAPQATASYGSISFTPVEGIPYTVAKTILPADNTITLSSFNTPDGRQLTMSNFGYIGYGTLDPNNLSRLESISFTGITVNSNQTVTLTGVQRGLDFVSPYKASTTLAQIHLVGSSFILSNTAGFYGNEFLFANNVSTSSAGIVFASTSPPHYDIDLTPTMWNNATGTTLVDLYQLNSTAISGAPNATQSVKGIVQLATALQTASSTIQGSTGANLVISSSNSTDTPQSACAVGYSAAGAGCNIIADLTGHLKQAWIDFTQPFTFTGPFIVNTASSTFPQTLNVGTLNVAGQTIPGRLVYGTGADGALSISSGTTTISCANGRICEKDYTSISITGTASLAFSNPNTDGTVIILRSQGACTDTSSAESIYTVGMGGAGGTALVAGNTGYGGAGGGPAGGGPAAILTTNTGANGAGGGGGGSSVVGTAGTNVFGNNILYSLAGLGGTAVMAIGTTTNYAEAGGGGGGGAGGAVGGNGGNGGLGGGGLVIDCGGAWNFTSGIINTSGSVGGAGSTNTTGGGGGGGGGAGQIVVHYASLTANSGTYSQTGGAGGAGGTSAGAGGAGASGTNFEGINNAFY